MSKPVDVATKAEFDQLLAKAGEQLVVVNFTAAWCGPCQKIKPKFLDMARDFAHVLFLVVDVDLNHETAAACNITAMPTYHFYKVGALVHMVRGASEEQLRAGVLAHSGDKWSNMQGHLLTATSSSSSGESSVSQSAAVPHAAPASAAEMRAARAAAAEARMRALQAQAK